MTLYYKDSEGKEFVDAVFNETVTFKEHDEGFDGETYVIDSFTLLPTAGS